MSRIYRLRLAPSADVLRVVQDLNANPAVAYAEPDYLAYVIATPNDPLYTGQWGLTQINTPAAWDVTTGSTDVVIAVIDAGIDASHPDLSGQLWTNPGEIAGNSVDDDNNGYVDDIHGWNLVDDNANLSDNTGHGTQVAGMIAAATNNSQGIAGVCWNCRLMVVKVVQSGGIANYSDIAAGVDYAAQKGAEVINLSLGGYSDSATLRAAIEAASQTAVVVGGAGNDNQSDAFYPAAYNDFVLAVAGTTITDTKVGTSNYGAWVDVSAPGEAITTTFDGGGYGSTSGTSIATPFAAGLAGLLRSQHPSWSANTVRAHIVQTTDDIGGLNPGYAGELGSGRIDAGQAVAATAQPLLSYQSHTVDGQPDGRPEPGSTVDLDVTLYNDWADAANVQATLSESDPYVTVVNAISSYGSIAAYESGANETSFRFSVAGGAPYAYDIPLTLNVTASGGYATSIPFTITTSPGIDYVHGTLTSQTWTNDRTYIVDNDVGVEAGHVLTIEAGMVIRFDGKYNFSVAGTLIADGTEEQPIRFTSNLANLAAGDWGQIKFLDSSVDATFDGEGNYISGSILRHTIIEYGQGVNLENAAPFIGYNTFDHIGGMIIGGSGSPGLVVAYNKITHIDDASYGMELSGADISIIENTVDGGMVGLSISGSGLVSENVVSGVLHWGIRTQGVLTVTANRVVDCGEGMFVEGGFVGGNLLANNRSSGLRINGGSPTVVSNTVVFNGEAGVYIESGTPALHHNNLVAAAGQYALHNVTSNPITATANWWGAASDTAIQSAIYDGNDEFGLGVVDYSGYLSGPEQDAPAYLTDVTLIPASPVGIQSVTFDLTFSRPMDQSDDPRVSFHNVLSGTWRIYQVEDSGLAGNGVHTIVIDSANNKWFGFGFGDNGISVLYADGSWQTYNSANSDLLDNIVSAIAEDGAKNVWIGGDNGVSVLHPNGFWTLYDRASLHGEFVGGLALTWDGFGNMWVGHYDGGATVLHPDGTWERFNLDMDWPHGNDVFAIATDAVGNTWFGTKQNGVSVLRADGTWQTYNSSNSDLSGDLIYDIVVDDEGNKWIATDMGGVSVLKADDTWQIYDPTNSGLACETVYAIAIDADGTKWFGTDGVGVARFDGAMWRVYNTSNSGLPNNSVHAIAIDAAGAKWFGTDGGVSVLYGGEDYPITDNAQWLDDAHWHATYDVTSLVPRGAYTISVSGAKGTDGMEIPTDTHFGFTVDYAGEITDQTPPNPPWIIAGGVEGDASTVEGMWSANDPDSSITGYRYAIGSSAGATDIVNWTNTSGNSMTRSGLGLVDGQQYWLAVQARNVGGLWSASAYGAFIAGQPYPKVFLPLVIKNH